MIKPQLDNLAVHIHHIHITSQTTNTTQHYTLYTLLYIERVCQERVRVVGDGTSLANYNQSKHSIDTINDHLGCRIPRVTLTNTD